MSITSADQTASNFEEKWTSIICDNTKFLGEWSHAILSIDYATTDPTRVLKHYMQYKSAWKAIRLGVLDAADAEANMTGIMLPSSQVEWAVDRTYVTVLTRWGDILRIKGDWVAATEKYQLAATHSERPDRKNPPASWVTLLGSWSHLLSDWGQTLQQSTDPLIELLESSRAEGKAYPRESMSRSKGSEQYKTFHANFNAFEKNYKSYTAHWLNSFHGQKPDGKSPVEISIWHRLNPESGDPTLGQMHAKLVANYKTLVDGFQPKPPEIPATPSVWPRQSASL